MQTTPTFFCSAARYRCRHSLTGYATDTLRLSRSLSAAASRTCGRCLCIAVQLPIHTHPKGQRTRWVGAGCSLRGVARLQWQQT